LEPLKSVAVLGLSVVFTYVYNADILGVWYPSIDIPFILLHVEFEDGSFRSVLKNKATRNKNFQPEIVKVENVKYVQTPPAHFISQLAIF
jgi:hypothetical protein